MDLAKGQIPRSTERISGFKSVLSAGIFYARTYSVYCCVKSAAKAVTLRALISLQCVVICSVHADVLCKFVLFFTPMKVYLFLGL